MTIITSFVVIAVLALSGVYVSWRAGRLDRLHARLEAARFALDAALVRRSSVALELASSGLLDPATSLLLASAAHDARSAQNSRGWEGGHGQGDGQGQKAGQGREDGKNGQELPESDLTRALRAVFGQPGFRSSLDGTEGADELLSELEGAAHQVFLARKF